MRELTAESFCQTNMLLQNDHSKFVRNSFEVSNAPFEVPFEVCISINIGIYSVLLNNTIKLRTNFEETSNKL